MVLALWSHVQQVFLVQMDQRKLDLLRPFSTRTLGRQSLVTFPTSNLEVELLTEPGPTSVVISSI